MLVILEDIIAHAMALIMMDQDVSEKDQLPSIWKSHPINLLMITRVLLEVKQLKKYIPTTYLN